MYPLDFTSTSMENSNFIFHNLNIKYLISIEVYVESSLASPPNILFITQMPFSDQSITKCDVTPDKRIEINKFK